MANSISTLTYKDIEGLPIELYKELSIPKSMKREFTIMKILDDNKGQADINLLIVKIFKNTDEIVTRKQMWNVLAKMKEKNLIESSEKKGFYKIKK